MAISKKVADRIAQQLRRYQGILQHAKALDINEADTVTIIVDMLADVFGYDKFKDVTKEFAIRGTYCDVAVKVGADVHFLIEAKAIGVPLKDTHVKQAVNYAANHGIDWVILTNGAQWRIYKIHFQRPIDKSIIFELDLLEIRPRDKQVIEGLGNLTREGFARSSMDEFYEQQQALSRFSLAAMLVTEPVLKVLRRELRRVAPNVRVDVDSLAGLLRSEVFKREVVESDEAKAAQKWAKKAVKKVSKRKGSKPAAPAQNEPVPAPAGTSPTAPPGQQPAASELRPYLPSSQSAWRPSKP